MDYSKFVPRRNTGRSTKNLVRQDTQAPVDANEDITYAVKKLKNAAVEVDEANTRLATQFKQDTTSHRFNKS